MSQGIIAEHVETELVNRAEARLVERTRRVTLQIKVYIGVGMGIGISIGVDTGIGDRYRYWYRYRRYYKIVLPPSLHSSVRV